MKTAETKKLVLLNDMGHIARTFIWQGDSAHLIKRLDTKRVELQMDLNGLKSAKVPFVEICKLDRTTLEKTALKLDQSLGAEFGRLKGTLQFAAEELPIEPDLRVKEDDQRLAYGSLMAIVVISVGFMSFILTRPTMTSSIQQELKQHVVQIVKKIPTKPPTQMAEQKFENRQLSQNVKTTSKTASIRRMGALAVLGSMNKGSQKGGIDLGAVNTTAGPGLGGNAGSGGVQTSLYGKGLMSAPLGAGGNMQGGGGYSTKGKGGGQAGYGKLSLVGSSGSQLIPLGKEALVQGGLDFDLVADVIQKNLGQIRFCYEQGLQSDPALAGRVEIAWTINGNGQVIGASVANTTLNSRIVEDCILLRLRSWKFPLPQGGVDVKVSYPFNLRRQGQG